MLKKDTFKFFTRLLILIYTLSKIFAWKRCNVLRYNTTSGARVNAGNANRRCVTWNVWQVYWLTICLILACVSSKINAWICHTMYRCNLSVSMCARIVSRHPNSSIAHSCVSGEWRSTSNSLELEKISERHGVFPGNLSSRFTFNYVRTTLDILALRLFRPAKSSRSLLKFDTAPIWIS